MEIEKIMSLERNFREHGVELTSVIQVGIDQNDLDEAWIYSAFGAERVIYLDVLPPKVMHARIKLKDHPRQEADMSAVYIKDGVLIRVFVDTIFFNTRSESLDTILMKKKINPLSINYINVNIDGAGAKSVLESADMLFRLGVIRYVTMENDWYTQILVGHGFNETYKGFYIRS